MLSLTNRRKKLNMTHLFHMLSEDKDDFVRPLAGILKEYGFGIWYDGFELEVEIASENLLIRPRHLKIWNRCFIA